MLKSFKDFLGGHDHKPPKPVDRDDQSNVPDEEHIRRFHELHRQLEETGHHLHRRGYHMEIEYKSDNAARHGKQGSGSTLFYNDALHSSKNVSVSKSAIAIQRNGKKGR